MSCGNYAFGNSFGSEKMKQNNKQLYRLFAILICFGLLLNVEISLNMVGLEKFFQLSGEGNDYDSFPRSAAWNDDINDGVELSGVQWVSPANNDANWAYNDETFEDRVISGELDYFDSSALQTTIIGPVNIGYFWGCSGNTENLQFIVESSTLRTITGFTATVQEIGINLPLNQEYELQWIYKNNGDAPSSTYIGWIEEITIWLDGGVSVANPFVDQSLYCWEDAMEIRWAANFTNTVSIELYDGETMVNQIATGETNDGFYTWDSIPTDIPGSAAYSIRITDENSADEAETTTFEIEEKDTVSNLVVDAEYYFWGDQCVFSWDHTGDGTVSIVIEEEAFHTIVEVVASTPNNGSYTWSPVDTGSQTGHWIANVTLNGDATQTDLSEYFDIYEPIVIENAYCNENAYADFDLNIYWTEGGGKTVTVEVFRSSDDVLQETLASSINNDGHTYWFNIPQIYIGEELYIRITSNFDSSKWDRTNNFNVLAPPYALTNAAVDKSIYNAKTEVAITWTDDGEWSSVKIDLLDNGVFSQEIISSTPNDGAFDWTIPADQAVKTGYSINITNNADPALFSTTSEFEIIEAWVVDNVAINDSSYIQEDDMMITWDAAGGGYVWIEIWANAWKAVNESTENDGQYGPYTLDSGTFPPGENYLVRITHNEDGTATDFSDSFEVVELVLYYQISNVEVNQSEFVRGDEIMVTWDSDGHDTVFIQIWDLNYYALMVEDSPNDGIEVLTIPSEIRPSGACTIRVAPTVHWDEDDESDVFILHGIHNVAVNSTSFELGDDVLITWDPSGELVVDVWVWDGMSSWIILQDDGPNDGELIWTVPLDSHISDTFKVRVYGDFYSNNYSVEFSVIAPLDYLISNVEVNQTQFVRGEDLTVTWTSDGHDTVYIQIWDYDGYALLVDDSANDGIEVVSIPLGTRPSNTCSIRVVPSNADYFEDHDESDAFILHGIYDVAVNSTTFELGMDVFITWCPSGEPTVDVWVWDGVSSWILLQDQGANDGEYVWTIPLDSLISDAYYIRVNYSSYSDGDSVSFSITDPSATTDTSTPTTDTSTTTTDTSTTSEDDTSSTISDTGTPSSSSVPGYRSSLLLGLSSLTFVAVLFARRRRTR